MAQLQPAWALALFYWIDAHIVIIIYSERRLEKKRGGNRQITDGVVYIESSKVDKVDTPAR